ncbi:MAG: DUF2169 domain-containing protein [Gammaproteobacteria bacterium]|nr:DUF2169 domain-containing protein [Gammaproteobacteria bacterium]
METEIWPLMSQYGSTVFDECRPKDMPEMIVVGEAVKPSGMDREAMVVELQMLNVNKRLLISGDRYWNSLGMASKPEPFERMPLSHIHAFGGEKFKHNPLGKGVEKVTTPEGDARIPLPNVEYLGQTITSSSQRPHPAYSYPNPPELPLRTRRLGTYDEEYLKNSLPDYADDVDWRYFNVAPDDQWFNHPLIGDEPFSITGMNADHPRLQGNLPAIRGRAFVTQQCAEEEVVKEIPLTLDTLWFFPNDDLCLMFYRGTMEVADPEGQDITHLLCAHENLTDSSRDLEFYAKQMTLRSDPDESYKYMLYMAPMLPEGFRFNLAEFAGVDMAAKSPMAAAMDNFSEIKKGEAMESLERQKQEILAKTDMSHLTESQRQQLENMGKPPSDPQPPGDIELKLKQLMEKMLPGLTKESPQLDDLDFTRLDFAVFDELEAYMDQLKQQEVEKALQQLEQQRRDLLQQLDKRAEAAMAVAKLDAVIGQIKLSQPPLLVRPDLTQADQQIRDELARVKQELKRIEPKQRQQMLQQLPDIDELTEQLRQTKAQIIDGYREGAHFVGESRSPHQGEEPKLVALLQKRVEQGESCTGVDLAFCDLSGLNLSGVDLSTAYLEYAILHQVSLDRANLHNAILAKAALTATTFNHTNLIGANLGAAQIEGCHFSHVDFSEATFGRSVIVNSTFVECDFGDRMDILLESEWRDCLFERCRFTGHNFIELNLTGCRFIDTDLTRSNFVKPNLQAAKFIRSDISGVNFVEPHAANADFSNSRAVNCRFVAGAELQGVTFTGADFSRSCFRDANLQNARLNDGMFNECDFGNARMEQVSASGARFVRSNLMSANLQYADFGSTNMMESSLMRADLRGCNFKDATLYGANFIGATLGETRFFGADLSMTILKDWRPL